MPGTYEKIATNTVSGSSTTNVNFNSIPSTYTDLVLIASNIINPTNLATMYIRFNSDSTSAYSDTYMEGNGSSGSSARDLNQTSLIAIGRSYGGDLTTNIINIMNYANTTTFKTAISRYGSGGASSAVGAAAGMWRSTSAITSITVGIQGGYIFSSGAVLTLYGIKAADL